MTDVKVRLTWGEALRAVDMARQLAKAGSNGMYGFSLTHDPNDRVRYGNWLRSIGVPVFAPKRGGNTRWYLLGEGLTDPAIADKVVRDDLLGHYARACRLRMSISRIPAYRAQCDLLTEQAIELGTLLGLSRSQINRDLEPLTAVSTLYDQLVQAGALPKI